MRYILDTIHWEEADMQTDENNTIVARNFHSTLMRNFMCLTCQNPSPTTEPCVDIPLAFPENAIHASDKLSIAKLLHSHFLPVQMDGEDMISCDYCGSEQPCELQNSIIKPPRYLILSMSRFKFDFRQQRKEKIQLGTDYPPILFLPVLEDAIRQKDIPYSLTAVIFHAGGAYGGHYYACGRHSTYAESRDDAQWYQLNDTMVSPIDYVDVCAIKATAQALVYTRTETSTNTLISEKTASTHHTFGRDAISASHSSTNGLPRQQEKKTESVSKFDSIAWTRA